METLNRYFLRLEAGIRILVVAIFIFMLVIVLLDVLARNTALHFRGLDELARYSQIWLIFLVTGIGIRYGELMGTDALMNLLPRRVKIPAWLLAQLLLLVFLALLAYYAWLLLEFLVRTNQHSANLRFPLWWAYVPLFLGTAMMFLSVLVDLLLRVARARRGGDLLAPPDRSQASAPWS